MSYSKFILKILFFLSVIFICCNSAFAADGAILVETAQVLSKSFAKKLTLTGSLRARQGITIRPEVAGRITQIYFQSGTIVQVGTPLVQLNKDIIQAELEQSKAELQLAQQNYDRMKTLYATRTISKADFDDVSSKLNVATAKVAENQAQLKQTLLVAPFTGKVGLSAVSVGDYLNVGQDIVSLQELDPIEVEFDVPEIYLSKININQIITITTDAFSGQIFTGKIYAIDALVNKNNRTFGVRAIIPNKDNKLLPGTFVETHIDLFDKGADFIIPQIAVFYDVGKSYVYKVVNNKAVKTEVKLGDRDQDSVVVLSGISSNDIVVTAGQLNLEDGALIRK